MTVKTSKGDYRLTLNSGQPTITRNFTFDDGSAIDFTVTLARDDEATLVDLHQRSLRHAITLLQGMLKSE